MLAHIGSNLVFEVSYVPNNGNLVWTVSSCVFRQHLRLPPTQTNPRGDIHVYYGDQLPFQKHVATHLLQHLVEVCSVEVPVCAIWAHEGVCFVQLCVPSR